MFLHETAVDDPGAVEFWQAAGGTSMRRVSNREGKTVRKSPYPFVPHSRISR